jgi:hypothetical protein
MPKPNELGSTPRKAQLFWQWALQRFSTNLAQTEKDRIREWRISAGFGLAVFVPEIDGFASILKIGRL